MGLILAPQELKVQIDSLRSYINDNMVCYTNAKESVQQYVSDEQLIAESWKASKEKMNICYAAIIAGASAALDSINSDLNILESSIGNEYLNENLIINQIKSYEEQCKTFEGLIEEAKSGQKDLEGSGCRSACGNAIGLITDCASSIAGLKLQIAVLQAKLDFLYSVNDTTANLFESAISMLSTVTAAISDGGCVIAGAEPTSNIDWKTEIMGFEHGVIDQQLDRCLESELGITLNEFKNLYGGNAVTQMREYVISGAICIREDMNSQAVVAKFLSVASGGYVVAVDGRYKFKDKESNQTVRYTAKEISELLRNHSGFLDSIGEAEVYAVESVASSGLSDEQMMANAQYVYDYLRQEGWSREAACGALGNFGAECGVNPGAWETLEDKYINGFGIAQITPASDFLHYIGISEEEFGKEDELIKSSPQELIDMEIEHIIWTSTISDTDIKRWYATSGYNSPFVMSYDEYIVSEEDVGKLALTFHASYERSNDTEEMKENRVKYATKFYEELE